MRYLDLGGLNKSRPDGEAIDQNSLLSSLSCGKSKILKSSKKENKNMKTDGQGNAGALEKQFEEEKSKDVKTIVKHCQFNLPSILLEMLLKDKAEDVKKYAMDLEAKEIAAAEANKACKSGE